MACTRLYTRLIAFVEKEMITIGRRTLAVFTTCSLLSLVFAPASWPNNVMPQTLVDVAHANGCNPIDDFFDEQDPDIMNPPYVLGWVRGVRYSAVFWCKKPAKSDKPYKLIFAAEDPATHKGFNVADPKQLAGCPAVIEYWNGPAGLRIETQHNLQLRYFHPVTDMRPKPGGPTGVLASAHVLVSDSGDGVEAIFLCYRGQWLIRLLD
jgi:hypothetical protein